jgi:CelD/BcsL family acetyltransferase involved in cellulose biosynthesis
VTGYDRMTRLTTAVLTDAVDLERAQSAWDSLAVDASRPYCAPGWALPWWSQARPAGAELRAITVHHGTDLVGVAPFYVTRDQSGITTWRLLADVTSSYVEPVADVRLRGSVAAAIASVLRDADRHVDVVSFFKVLRGRGWPTMLREAWPGWRPAMSVVTTTRSPHVDIPDAGVDGWLASRSNSFRKQLRSRQREFQRHGGTFRRASSPGELASALADFERLHTQRWADRGGSRALTAPIVEMVNRAGRWLDPTRLHVWTADIDGTAVSSAVFLAAGAELHYWLSGFSDTWSRVSPSMILLAEAIRHAANEGYQRVSLGPGTAAYKYRFATGEDILDSVDLIPHGRRYAYVRMRQLPYRAYRFASNRTPPKVKERLRSSAFRVVGRHSGTGQERQDAATQ